MKHLSCKFPARLDAGPSGATSAVEHDRWAAKPGDIVTRRVSFEVALLREALVFHSPTRQRGEVNIVFPSLTLRVMRKLTLRVLRKAQLQNA
ncbi:MAG: hypothetical protein ACF8AM_23160 [Rhodopirellula sp. JB055]|uniref:hypothetical protein n=1 Tax=Rhodopirellula sp. JB055 TaxID=3342846 RepID=UPI00370A0D24